MSAGSTFSCGVVTRTTMLFSYNSKEGPRMVCRPKRPTPGQGALIQVPQLSLAISLPTPFRVCRGLIFASIGVFPISTSHTTFQCVLPGRFLRLHRSEGLSDHLPADGSWEVPSRPA